MNTLPDITYMLISALDTDEMEEAVNAYLSSGWRLQGGPIVWPEDSKGKAVMIQAMIKEEPSND